MVTRHDESIIEYLQTIPSDVLSQFVKGEVDVIKLASIELSYRGQDRDGKWVGFKQAVIAHNIDI
ncbi:MAG: hypothetical protein ACO1N8_06450 [Methylophilus sp.]